MAVTDIKVGTDGVCYVAPEGTTLPTSTASTLNVAFVDLGEVSTEGLGEAALDSASEYIRNWKGTPVRSFNPETTFTFSITFLETTKAVLDLYFGSTVVSVLGDKSEIEVGQPNNTPVALVIPVVDSKDNSVQQWVVPRAVVSEREPITYANSAAVAYKVTFSALYDAGIDNFAKLQFDNDLTS